MSLIQTIRTNALQARKDAAQTRTTEGQVTAVLLSTLLSDIQTVGKNDGGREPTQAEALKMTRKFLSGAQESLTVLSAKAVPEGTAPDVRIAQLTIECAVLTALVVPYEVAAMSTDELTQVIAAIVAELPVKNAKQMGVVMKSLKDGYAGRYDGGAAGALVKAALA